MSSHNIFFATVESWSSITDSNLLYSLKGAWLIQQLSCFFVSAFQQGWLPVYTLEKTIMTVLMVKVSLLTSILQDYSTCQKVHFPGDYLTKLVNWVSVHSVALYFQHPHSEAFLVEMNPIQMPHNCDKRDVQTAFIIHHLFTCIEKFLIKFYVKIQNF